MKYNKLFTVILCLFVLLCGFAMAQKYGPNNPNPDWKKIPVYNKFTPAAGYYDESKALPCRLEQGGRTYDLVEYMHEEKESPNAAFIEYCCERSLEANCISPYVSRFDGNTLVLSAAETGNLPALKYFVTEKEYTRKDGSKITKRAFDADYTLRQNRNEPLWGYQSGTRYDKAGRTELMHAISLNHLEMVKFLLGVGNNANIDKDGKKIRYSNPRRLFPHPDDNLHLKYDARDYARWHRGKINEEIITLVENAWETAAPFKGFSPASEYYKEITKRQAFDIKPRIFDIQRDIKYAINNIKSSLSLNFRKSSDLDNVLNRLLTEKSLATIIEKAKEKPDKAQKPQLI